MLLLCPVSAWVSTGRSSTSYSLNRGVQLVSFRTNHPSNESTLSLFFRSLLPNFNLQVRAVSCLQAKSEPTFAFSTQVSTAQCFCKGSGSWHMQCVNVRLQSSLMLFGRRHCLSLPAAARQRAPCRGGPPALLSCRGTSGTMEMTRPEQGRTSTRG